MGNMEQRINKNQFINYFSLNLKTTIVSLAPKIK